MRVEAAARGQVGEGEGGDDGLADELQAEDGEGGAGAGWRGRGPQEAVEGAGGEGGEEGEGEGGEGEEGRDWQGEDAGLGVGVSADVSEL